MFKCQAKSRDETALLIVLASETEVELDEVRLFGSATPAVMHAVAGVI